MINNKKLQSVRISTSVPQVIREELIKGYGTPQEALFFAAMESYKKRDKEGKLTSDEKIYMELYSLEG